MIRKLLTSALCLLLALALPLCSFAATEYTVAVVPGDALASVQAAKDLLDVLSLRLLAGEESGMLTIALGDQDAISLALRATSEGLYVQSESLSDKPLYFSAQDIKTLMVNAMKESGSMEEASVAAVEQTIDKAFAGMGSFGLSAETLTAKPAATKEEAIAQIREQLKDDPALADYIAGVLERAVETEGDFTDAAHDPATKKVETSITTEDLLKIMDSTTVRKAMESSAKQAGKSVDEIIAEVKKMLEGLEYNIPLTWYMAGDEETLVAMEMPMTMKGTVTTTSTDEDGKETTQEEAVDVAMNLVYNRLTTDGVANHAATLAMQNAGKEMANFAFTITHDQKDNYTLDGSMTVTDSDASQTVMLVKGALGTVDNAKQGWLGMLSGDTQITLGYTGQEVDGVKQKSISIYTRSDAAAVVEPAAADRPLVTLNVTAKETSEDALAAVNGATAESSLNLLQMSSEEQQTALSDIMTRLQQTLFTALGNLPPSVLELFTASSSTAQAQ